MLRSRSCGINYAEIILSLMKVAPPIDELKDYHIDHVIPLKYFDLTQPEQVAKAFSANNLQWLPRAANLRKGSHTIIRVILNPLKGIQ